MPMRPLPTGLNARRWLRRLCLVLGLAGAAMPPALAAAPPSFDPQALQSVADAIAADLMRGIKAAVGGEHLKLAVRPFRPDAVVPEDAAGQLNNAVEIALKRAAGDKITILDRADLQAVWNEADEFQPQATLDQHIKDAGANILVLGELRPVPGGFDLTYKADDLRPGSTGEVLGVMREPHFLPSTFVASTGRPLDEAVRTAAIEMARRIVEGTPVEGGHPRLQDTGETTPFGDYVMQLFMTNVEQQLPNALRRQAGQQAETGAAPAAPAKPARITFGLTVYDLDRWVDVKFADESPDGSENTSVMTRISMDSIPANLLPIKPRCGSFVHTVSGEALVGKLLDREGALRAARALARARAVAEETCASVAGAPSVVRDTADAAWAMQAIAGGVTYDEHWSESTLDDGQRVRTVLQARVRTLGGGAPAIKATLSPPVVETAAPFGITLSTDQQAYVAVFGWQSDDRVLRLYPFGGQHALPVADGRPLQLPRRGDAPFATEPRPGLTTDFEALIVVASAKPLDYDGIAQEVAPTAEESMQRARPVGELFAALAKIETPLSLTVVPYQIVPKH